MIEIYGNLQFDAIKLRHYAFIYMIYIYFDANHMIVPSRNSNYTIYRSLHCSDDKLHQICQTLISGNKTMKQT